MTIKITTQFQGFSDKGRHLLLFSLLTILPFFGWGQSTLLNESFGTSATLPTGWTASSTVWSGSTASASSGYPSASGGANAIFNNTGTSGVIAYLTYSNSLSTVGYTNISVLWGGRATATYTQPVTFQWSSDGTNWNTVSYTQVVANATWALVNNGTRITLPAGAEGVSSLRFRFSAAANSNGNYRIDDFTVQGTATGTTTIALSSTGPSAANVAPAATNVLLYALNLNVTNGPVTLQNVALTTAGTYTVSDLQNSFRLFYSTDAVYDAGDVALGTAALAGTGATLNFSTSQSVATGSANYLLLVADIAAAPTSGRTIGITATANTALTFATGTVSGSGNAGGLQTIVVPSPAIAVTQGVTAIATGTGSYNFGSTGWGSNNDVTFTITNSGNANLTFSTPVVSGTGFSLLSSPTSPVAPSGTTTFTVRFSPNGIGAFNGSVSIANNDAARNPYTFNLSGTGIPSNQSDVIANGSFTYSSNIDYTQYSVATITNTSQSAGVFGLTIRDGGASGDADNLPTIVTGITFSSVAGTGSLLNAALFNGNALVSSASTIGTSTISFSSLNINVADNGTQNLTLRVTFKQTAAAITDNQQLSFTLANTGMTTAGSNTSSSFGTFSLTSSTAGNNNKLVVSASTIAFGTQPADSDPAVNLSAFTIRAVDANGNQDLDFGTCQVNLTSSGTGFSSASPYTFSSGLITVSDAQFATSQNGVTITATAQSCLSSASATSTAFNIVTIPGAAAGDYRSTASGNITTAGIWQQYNGTSWVNIAGAPGSGTTNKIFIRHSIGSNGANSRDKLVVISGGTYTNTGGSSTFASLLEVRDGGVLQINSFVGVGSTGTFRVEDGGTVNVNTTYATPSSSIWAGIEYFEPGSTFRFQNWTNTVTIVNSNTVVTSNTFNGYTAMFGNISLDFGSNDVDGLDILASAVSGNLTHGNLTFTSGLAGNSMSIGGTTVGIGGNLVIASTFQRTLNMRTSGTLVLTVNGNYVQSSGIVRLLASSGGSVTLTVNGNMSITGGTFDMNSTNSATATSIVNLKGNLTVTSPGVLQNSNINGALAATPTVLFNFTGTIPQVVNVSTTVATLPIRVLSGATVQLAANFNVSGSASYATIVRTGGTFNFNGFDYTGAGSFIQEAGATLKITSPQGIELTGTTGNVQSTASGRSFHNAGIYHYTGTMAQVTGLGLNPAAGHKVIIIDNPTSVTLSQSVAFSSTSSSTPGGIDIRQGIFQGSAGAFVTVSSSTNDIYLTMAAGTVYRFTALTAALPAGNLNLPQAGGTYNLAPTSVIELIGTGDQILRGSKPYGSITFGGSGTKTLTSNVSTVTGTVTIEGAITIVDVQTHALGGSVTNFTMTGGRFRTARTTDTQPNMDGIYNLTGGVVEFYGTNASTSQTIRGAKSYFNVEIGADVANTALHNVLHGNGNISIAGEFRIKTPAVYQIGSTNFIVGNGSFFMEPGSTLKYGDVNGITLAGCGTGATCGSIRTVTRSFPSTASYGFVNSSTMVTGNGLPSSVVNLYLQKGTAATTVTLSNPLIVNGEAALTTGTFIIGNNLLTLSGTATGTGNGTISGSATSNIVINGTGTLGTLYFTAGARQLQSLILNKTLSGSATLGTDLAIANILTLTNGTLNIGSGAVLTLDGLVSRTSGMLGGTATSGLVINGSGALGADLVFAPVAASLQNLTLNRSNSKIKLGTQLSVFGNVSFLNGLLETASSTELVFEDNATQTGAGVMSHIAGPAIKVGNDAFTFPIGTDTLYAPIAISAPAAVTERYRAQYYYTSAQDAVSDSVNTPLVRVSDIEYWQLQQQAGSSNVQVTLSFSNVRKSGVTDLSALRVARFIGPEWVDQGNASVAGSAANGLVSSVPVTGYGLFTLASVDENVNPLPVELLSFTGALKNNQVVLNWVTASERGSASYIIERSIDGLNYRQIGEVSAVGNSVSKNEYTFIDESPAAALAYYRLKQVDSDNTYRYYGPVVIRRSGLSNEVVLYPNPAISDVSLQFYLANSGTATIQLFDVTGSQKLSINVAAQAGMNQQLLQLEKLAKGAYLIMLTTPEGSFTQKLLKE